MPKSTPYARDRSEKRCPSCGRTRPRCDFDNEPSQYDGLCPYCKDCQRIRQRERERRRQEKKRGEQDGHCYYCGALLTRETFTQDHIVARCNGGTDDAANLVSCCLSCNTAKGHRTLEEFRALRARQRDGVPWFSREQLAYLASAGIELPGGDQFIFWGEFAAPSQDFRATEQPGAGNV